MECLNLKFQFHSSREQSALVTTGIYDLTDVRFGDGMKHLVETSKLHQTNETGMQDD